MNKYFVLSMIFFISTKMGFSQADSFDVFSYQKPEFFTKSEQLSCIEFSLINGDGSFCSITLYKSIPSAEDTVQTILNQWNEFVLKRLTKADKKPVQTLTGQAVEGWASSLAIGNFYPDEKKAIVMLLSFRERGRSACVVFTCSDKSFKGPIEVFSNSIHLIQQQ